MSGPDLATTAALAADEKGATDVVAFDVTEILGICDTFVICSCSNSRLVGAVADEIRERLGDVFGRKPIASEGLDARRWVLLDYGELIVHLFLTEEREYYRLDRLYSDAPRLDLSDLSGPV